MLLYFGLDSGMLEFFKYVLYSRAVLQRTIVVPAFLESGLAEKIAVCVHCTYNPSAEEVGDLEVFLYEAA